MIDPPNITLDHFETSEDFPLQDDPYVAEARRMLKGKSWLHGTADYCLAGYLRIRDQFPIKPQ